jgi:DNA-binding MarR family transcriptional regulator
MHYAITPKASQIIDEIAIAKENMDKMVFKGITKEEIEIYKKITEKMLKNIRDIIR